jgi:hypothetical protein
MSSVEGPGSLSEQAVLPPARYRELLPRVLHGAFWILNSNLFGRALNLARGVILARLLVPGDFGLFGFAVMFKDMDVLYSYGIVGVYACPVSRNESA